MRDGTRGGPLGPGGPHERMRHGNHFRPCWPGPMFGGAFGARGRAWHSRGIGGGNGGTARLALLAELAMEGHEMTEDRDGRAGGVWPPSPGSVSPTLRMLEDVGLVVSEEQGGK